MRRHLFPLARHRLVLVLPLTLALTLIAVPVVAGPTPGVGAAQQAANAAKQDAQNAKDAAKNADTALGQAKAALAAANAHLLVLNGQISALNGDHRRGRGHAQNRQRRARVGPWASRRLPAPVLHEWWVPGDARVRHLGEQHRGSDPARRPGERDLNGERSTGAAHRCARKPRPPAPWLRTTARSRHWRRRRNRLGPRRRSSRCRNRTCCSPTSRRTSRSRRRRRR